MVFHWRRSSHLCYVHPASGSQLPPGMALASAPSAKEPFKNASITRMSGATRRLRQLAAATAQHERREPEAEERQRLISLVQALPPLPRDPRTAAAFGEEAEALEQHFAGREAYADADMLRTVRQAFGPPSPASPSADVGVAGLQHQLLARGFVQIPGALPGATLAQLQAACSGLTSEVPVPCLHLDPAFVETLWLPGDPPNTLSLCPRTSSSHALTCCRTMLGCSADPADRHHPLPILPSGVGWRCRGRPVATWSAPLRCRRAHAPLCYVLSKPQRHGRATPSCHTTPPTQSHGA